jgi:predicted anti-sigma-YlaC factor YlaD
MINCARHQSNFSSLLDEEIEFNQKFDLQRHIAECQDCSTLLLKWREFQAFFSRELHASLHSIPDLWSDLATKLPTVCELQQEEFSAYLDDELPASAQDGIRNHLHDCAPCRKQFAGLTRTNELVSGVVKEALDVDVDLWGAVKTQLNANCALINAELSPFVDQEVPNLHHRNIAQHLMECATCDVSFRKLFFIGELMRQNYAPVLSDNFDLLPGIKSKMRVLGTAKEEPRTWPKRPAIVISLAVVAAVTLIGLVAVWCLLSMKEPTPPLSSEAYLIKYSLTEPAKNIEAAVADELQ